MCSHKKDGIVKSNIGYWGNITEQECKPIRNQETMDEFYRRDKTGTDLYIIGAKLEKEEWVENIIYSVIENFWKLIIEDKLEVSIVNNGQRINIDSKNVRALAQMGKEDNAKIDEHDIFNAYKFIELNDSVEDVRYGSICSENDVELKIAKLPQYPEKKILRMRETEMKINIFSPRRRPVNFIGILIAKGEELNRQLRESEPQTHDAWNADNIEDEDDRRKVRNTIKRLDAWLNEQIDSLSYVDNIPEFDAEGLDFLTLEDEDSNGIEEIQKPFDEIINQEIEEQEILAGQNSPTQTSGVDKTKDEEPRAGGEGDGDQPRDRDGKNKATGSEENTSGRGDSYHEIKMKYVKTPYDSDNNRYRVIIRPVENIESSEIHFLRCTDSGELEKINVKKATINGTELEISGNVIKNINLTENEDTKIDIEFDTKRKCIMEVRIYVQN